MWYHDNTLISSPLPQKLAWFIVSQFSNWGKKRVCSLAHESYTATVLFSQPEIAKLPKYSHRKEDTVYAMLENHIVMLYWMFFALKHHSISWCRGMWLLLLSLVVDISMNMSVRLIVYIYLIIYRSVKKDKSNTAITLGNNFSLTKNVYACRKYKISQ